MLCRGGKGPSENVGHTWRTCATCHLAVEVGAQVPGWKTNRPSVGYFVEHFAALVIRQVKRIEFCNNLLLATD
jgi:hypothetical protein